MNEQNDSRNETINYLRASIPIAAAMVIFLLSAGFIVYKFILAYRHNERWKDYDECGLS
ncbi:MAG: hypothetical protein J1F11_04870 [Oscillospiraceae bacterium]|nr:hypothetical protein [Oscillospiraceae bacterium]